VLESLLIRNINLPTSVKRQLSKINAEQDAQKWFCSTKRSKQNVKKEWKRKIADYQRIISTGLTDKQLRYETIKAQKNGCVR
jgi:hypothetical protein